MLDGRIDHQGAVDDLGARGILGDITRVAGVEVPKEEPETPRLKEDTKQRKASWKPRKLVEDEHREIGGVKWSIYQSYLKFSYVLSC